MVVAMGVEETEGVKVVEATEGEMEATMAAMAEVEVMVAGCRSPDSGR